MKATAEQLEKIDWKKLQLADFRGLKVHAAKAPAGPFPYIEAEGYFPIAHRSADDPYTWDTRRATTLELEQIVRMCKTVDAFIASEIAAMELAEKRERTKPKLPPDFEYCSKSDADSACQFSGTYWTQWFPVSAFAFEANLDSYLFSRRITKPKPKLPTVKAPDGWSWIAGDYLRLQRADGHIGSMIVPGRKEDRDVLSACVAAFDEAQGVASIEFDAKSCRFDTNFGPPPVEGFRNESLRLVTITECGSPVVHGVPKFPNGMTVRIAAKP